MLDAHNQPNTYGDSAFSQWYYYGECNDPEKSGNYMYAGYGFTDEFPVSRFFRGVRYGSLGGGTTETLRNLVGRRLVEDMDLATGVAGLGTF